MYAAPFFQRWGPRTARTFAFGVVAIVGVVLAYRGLFGLFADYDDEGYVLVSLKGYLAGSPLYEELYSQYGPFFFVWWGGIFRILGLNISHDTSRLVTLTLWIGMSLLAGLSIAHLTRSFIVGLGSMMLVFATEYVLVNEPMHPGGLLSLLLLAVVATATWVVPRAPKVGMGVIGGLVAAASLVKVNVGGVAFVSVMFAAALSVRPFPGRSLVRVVAAAAFLLAPALLMAGSLGEGWAQVYALHVTVAALGVALVSNSFLGPSSLRPSALGWFVTGAAILTVLVLSLMLTRGTSFQSFFRGVVLGPLGQRDAFTLALFVPRRYIIWTLLGLAGAALASLTGGRAGRHGGGTPYPGIARLTSGLFIWIVGTGVWHAFGPPFILALPVIWVAAIPLAPDREYIHPFIRLLLPAIAVLQTLHAFPVAGSQIAWSGLLLVPVGAICIADGATELSAWARRRFRLRTSLPIRVVAMIPVVIFLMWFAGYLASFYSPIMNGYEAGVRPGLPGTTRLRLPADQVGVYRTLTSDLRMRCTSFLVLPGVNSLYLFSEMEPPTYLNATAWMYLFDAPTQQRIVERVSQIEGLCVVRNSGLVDFWRQGRPIPSRPLIRFIDQGFAPVAAHGPFDILVPVEAAFEATKLPERETS